MMTSIGSLLSRRHPIDVTVLQANGDRHKFLRPMATPHHLQQEYEMVIAIFTEAIGNAVGEDCCASLLICKVSHSHLYQALDIILTGAALQCSLLARRLHWSGASLIRGAVQPPCKEGTGPWSSAILARKLHWSGALLIRGLHCSSASSSSGGCTGLGPSYWSRASSLLGGCTGLDFVP